MNSITQDFTLVYKAAVLTEYTEHKYGNRWLEFANNVKDNHKLILNGTYMSLAVL